MANFSILLQTETWMNRQTNLWAKVVILVLFWGWGVKILVRCCILFGSQGTVSTYALLAKKNLLYFFYPNLIIGLCGDKKTTKQDVTSV